MDLQAEPQHVLDLYGAKPDEPSFANTCLLARRLVERGVRFVEIFHEAWDQHGNLVKDLKKNCKDTEQACAGLVQDLKQRGMLDDTLVVWGGEFGALPWCKGADETVVTTIPMPSRCGWRAQEPGRHSRWAKPMNWDST